LINDRQIDQIEWVKTTSLTVLGRNPRSHPAHTSRALRRSIQQVGFIVPILINEQNQIIAGHARVQAAVDLGMAEIPAVRISHLSEAEIRAFRIADNRLTELGEWDKEVLAIEFRDLLDLDFEIELTGFDFPEIDIVLASTRDRTPEADVELASGPAVTQPGDLWVLNEHRLLCGDARDPGDHARLLRGDEASMIFTDPPYNVPIEGHVSGGGRIKHREFEMASGELSVGAVAVYQRGFLRCCIDAGQQGALIYVCIDWRSASLLEAVAHGLGLKTVAWCVWAKTNAGMGSFYRSQHEFVLVFREEQASHRNNVRLGRYGRNRTNVWTYEGANTFRRSRRAELRDHPTPKPVDMVVDAILDCTRPGDIVLDPFLGGGTTLIECKRTDRRCRAIEIDPIYVDTSIQRREGLTGGTAVCARTGRSFADMAAERDAPKALPAPDDEEGQS